MSTYKQFSAIIFIILSLATTANANTPVITAKSILHVGERKCKLDENEAYQLHEIRTEQRHTRLMLQNIEGVDNQLINNARRQLQNRLIKIDQVEQFFLFKFCQDSMF